QTARTRLAVYEAQTRPVSDYYRDQGKLLAVNGEGPIDDVFERITLAMLAAGLVESDRNR
ncbi:MAG TPA: hypothetical protein VFK80_07600, partial [Limnochordia bacterium]|nr:hypothetical protein [Limnochordia bacterium]